MDALNFAPSSKLICVPSFQLPNVFAVTNLRVSFCYPGFLPAYIIVPTTIDAWHDIPSSRCLDGHRHSKLSLLFLEQTSNRLQTVRRSCRCNRSIRLTILISISRHRRCSRRRSYLSISAFFCFAWTLATTPSVAYCAIRPLFCVQVGFVGG